MSGLNSSCVCNLFSGLNSSCVCNLFIGLEEAQNHWAISRRSDAIHCLGHRLVAVIECIPLFGKFIAINERCLRHITNKPLSTTTERRPEPRAASPEAIGVMTEDLETGGRAGAGVGAGAASSSDAKEIGLRRKALSKDWNAWKFRMLSEEETFQKMKKNLEKSIKEHLSASEDFLPEDSTTECYASIAEVRASEKDTPLVELRFDVFESESIGKSRLSMEDAHFVFENELGVLTGVFDGHGDDGLMAKEVNRRFLTQFFIKLEETHGHVHKAFELLFEQIDISIPGTGGTTAVISFFEKRTNLVYTATLGDSEANIYRRIDGNLRSIPLSVIRDWASQSEATRMSIYLNKPQIALNWPTQLAKFLRTPPAGDFYMGINVSRAFGDYSYKSSEKPPCVINKPKITVCKILPGDTLVLACDGLKDFVKEKDIVKALSDTSSDEMDLSQKLIKEAIKKMPSYLSAKGRVYLAEGDNVTVVALQAHL